jgi:DNA-binding Xre family transcriptional regulator
MIKAMMEARINDTELAKTIGMNRTTIYRIKRGGNTSTEVMERIAKALKVEVKELL